MSDHSEEKAGGVCAIALYLDHSCTAPEIQLNSKRHGISNLLILASIFPAFLILKPIFFQGTAPPEKENLSESPKSAFCEAKNQPFVKSGLWVWLNRSPFFLQHSWGPPAPQDRCSPAEAVPRNVLAGTKPAHTAGMLLHVLLESFVVVSEQNHPSSFLFH